MSKLGCSAKMKLVMIAAIAVSLSQSVLVASPADDSTGQDLLNAAKLGLIPDWEAEDQEEMDRAIYMLGYMEGAFTADIWTSMLSGADQPAIDWPEDGLKAVLRDISAFIEPHSIAYRTYAAKPMFCAITAMNYGRTPEMKKKGLNMLMKIVGKEFAEFARKQKQEAEQGEKADTE